MTNKIAAVAAAVLSAVGLATTSIAAQAQRSATLTKSDPTVSWQQSAPMTGSAFAARALMCQVPTDPCDDFTINVDRGTDTKTKLAISLKPSQGARMLIAVYAPGCDAETAPPSPSCVTTHGTEARLLHAENGRYLVRITCDECTAATYSATATLSAMTDDVPPAGDQSFAWEVQQLPLKPEGSTLYGEPGIWINKLGHAIVNTFGPTVWISTDNGRTWGPALDSVDSTPCRSLSGDADAVVSDDDVYYAVNLCLAGPTNLSYSSRDSGKTWNAEKGRAPTVPGVATDSDRQWYGLDSSNPAVVYLSYHDLAGPNIWVLKSTDHGETWTQQVPITAGAGNFIDAGIGNTTSRPLVDPTDSNTVVVFYSSNTAVESATSPPNETDFNLSQVWTARSTDGGLTWTNTMVYDAGRTNGLSNRVAHLFAAGAMDAAGNAYAVVSQRNGGQASTHLQLVRVPKGSTGQPATVPIDTGGLGANVFPWITAGDVGHVGVSWVGSTATNHDDVDAQWSEMFAMTTDALAASPTFVRSRVSGPTAMHAGDICMAGLFCSFTGGNRNLADFQMIAVDPCGRAQMVWTDDAHGANVTMHARQTAGPTLRPSAACAATDVLPGVSGGGSGAGGSGGSGSGGGGVLPATGKPWMWGAVSAAAVATIAMTLLRRRARHHHNGNGRHHDDGHHHHHSV